jgi:hypothetical protein
LIYLELTDGRIVGFPADRFRILSLASELHHHILSVLKNQQAIVGGHGNISQQAQALVGC